jgi:branched-subunit amino acid ABC-type transport system permease component
MRAVVDDPDLVGLHGTSARRVRRTAWIIGTTFAAASGVLVAPLIGVEPVLLTFLVVEAFGAAAIGAFSGIPLTFAGAIAIGVVADISGVRTSSSRVSPRRSPPAHSCVPPPGVRYRARAGR